jgi:hypothetical protein
MGGVPTRRAELAVDLADQPVHLLPQLAVRGDRLAGRDGDLHQHHALAEARLGLQQPAEGAQAFGNDHWCTNYSVPVVQCMDGPHISARAHPTPGSGAP